MKAVILAAGKGKRLGEVTRNIPKPMIKINGKPILERNILMCKRAGIKDIFINLHYLPQKIKDYFHDGSKFGVNIHYHYEPTILGTAGATLSFIDKLYDEPFFVIYGDNYTEFDLSTFWRFHVHALSEFTIALHWRKDISQSGVAELAKNGRILRFVEKPQTGTIDSHWVNAGIYLIEPIILNEMKKNRYYDFGHDVIPLLIASGFNIYGYKMKKRVIAVDTPELLRNAKLKYGD